MPGLLLDTHALYWLVTQELPLTDDALIEIGNNQASGSLYVSPITAWELALAARKPARANPMQLNKAASAWFSEAVRAVSAKVIAINAKIAVEAAEVPVATRHKDPGDCYLIATARVRKLSLMTRDSTIQGLASPHFSPGCDGDASGWV